MFQMQYQELEIIAHMITLTILDLTKNHTSIGLENIKNNSKEITNEAYLYQLLEHTPH